jgi:hypothetical protein
VNALRSSAQAPVSLPTPLGLSARSSLEVHVQDVPHLLYNDFNFLITGKHSGASSAGCLCSRARPHWAERGLLDGDRRRVPIVCDREIRVGNAI